MRLPNGDRAQVDLEKLTSYCLNTEHPRGKHKARVFAAALGLTAADADRLRTALLTAAAAGDGELRAGDGYGQRYVIDFNMSGPHGLKAIRSSWIVRASEDFPRFTSCYVR